MLDVDILEHLTSVLDVPVHAEKPEPSPDEYVLFEKTGGGRNNHLLSSTYVFQSYSTSKYKAGILNEKTKTAVDSLITLNLFSGVRLNSDYPFPDIETKQYRYQAVYDFNHY